MINFSIHPRYKRQIATRLALAAFQTAYADASEGRFQGAFPTELDLEGSQLTITYDDGDVELVYRPPTESWPVAFEVTQMVIKQMLVRVLSLQHLIWVVQTLPSAMMFGMWSLSTDHLKLGLWHLRLLGGRGFLGGRTFR